jgi:hypothetical protein
VAVAESPDRTQFGRDISVGASEEVGDVTCFGCSIRVRGHVAGDVTTFGGSIVVEDQGQIDGDATTFAGGVRLGRQTKVDGDLTVFGGAIRRDPQATVDGSTTNFGVPISLLFLVVIPCAVLGGLIALIVFVIRRITRPSLPAAA